MNREIKFKCWDGKKMWKYAVPLFAPAHNGGMINVSDQENGSFNKFVNGKLLQYTDYKDKNNTQICEGDKFFLLDRRFTYTVTWKDSGLVGDSNTTKIYISIKDWCDEIEVIGNIYENKQIDRYCS